MQLQEGHRHATDATAAGLKLWAPPTPRLLVGSSSSGAKKQPVKGMSRSAESAADAPATLRTFAWALEQRGSLAASRAPKTPPTHTIGASGPTENPAAAVTRDSR